ncbi:MAG: hypothetical protein ABI618_00985 [Nitrospirota bacterium]
MNCSRCHGLMVMDTCLNKEGVRNTIWVYEWRCLNCGETFDLQTLSNRNICRHKASSSQTQEVA